MPQESHGGAHEHFRTAWESNAGQKRSARRTRDIRPIFPSFCEVLQRARIETLLYLRLPVICLIIHIPNQLSLLICCLHGGGLRPSAVLLQLDLVIIPQFLILLCSSSCAMARNGNRSLILLVAILVLSILAQGAHHGPKHLQLFAHESRVPPTNTLIVSASPDGNFNGTDEFGLIRTVSNVLREGRSNESKEIGGQVGIVVVGKGGRDVYISYTYFLNENATHQGTIAIHGHIDGTQNVTRVFGVVGGTGDFLGVTGEDRSAFDAPNPPDPANVVNVHNLTLLYPYAY